jgi:hypothetical protein
MCGCSLEKSRSSRQPEFRQPENLQGLLSRQANNLIEIHQLFSGNEQYHWDVKVVIWFWRDISLRGYRWHERGGWRKCGGPGSCETGNLSSSEGILHDHTWEPVRVQSLFFFTNACISSLD